MNTYKFAVSRKVKLWITDYVDVYAETKEDALEELNAVKDEALKTGWPLGCFDLANTETDWDDVAQMTKEENDGNEVERIEYIGRG